MKHVLKPHHIKRTFLKRKSHDTEHQYHEVLQPGLATRQALKLIFYQLQLPVKHKTTYLGGRVLSQCLHVSTTQKLLSKLQHYLHALFTFYHVPQRTLQLQGTLLLLEPQLLELLALESLHKCHLLNNKIISIIRPLNGWVVIANDTPDLWWTLRKWGIISYQENFISFILKQKSPKTCFFPFLQLYFTLSCNSCFFWAFFHDWECRFCFKLSLWDFSSGIWDFLFQE